MSQENKRTEVFRKNLRELPAFLALLRAVEHGLIAGVEFEEPVLDLGCGDGYFGSIAFATPPDVGMDLGSKSVMDARRRKGTYQAVVQASAENLPFANGCFGSVISNSVLEHIPQYQKAVQEIARVLRPGSLLFFTVPSEYFREFLSGSGLLSRIGLHSMARAYQWFFDRISRHYHYHTLSEWRAILEGVGFEIKRYRYYFSRRALGALERWHYLGLPALVCRKITGRWVIVPSDVNLWLTEKILRRHHEELPPELGAYLFIVARRLF